MKTIATLCTGFDGVGVGAKRAGLEVTWGIELDPAIAAVANVNLGNHVCVANLLACDPADFEKVDVLHASPPCPAFSVANANSGEKALDIALARKVAEFITELRPRVFTLENVIAYRHSKSWHIVEAALYGAGYWLHIDHVNAADFAVPQTRKRMIVRALRGGFVPYLPEPVPWVGWYVAIEDLLPTLPESQFAPWQLARLPELLMTTLVAQNGYEGKVNMAREDDPSFTITANHNQLGLKAFLMAGGGNTNLVEAYPGRGCRYEEEPSHTVTTTEGGGTMPKAFLIGDQQRQLAEECDPSFTVRAGENGGAMPKAWLVSSGNTSRDLTVRDDDAPSFTVTASHEKTPARALLDMGRVVAMTPRALARFQSFPDWYELPDNARLAAKGIGNAVPPLLYQRIIAPLLEVL